MNQHRWLYFAMIPIILFFTGCATNSTASDLGYKERVININASSAKSNIIGQIIMLKDLLQPLLPEEVTVEWSNIYAGGDIRDSMIAGNTHIAMLGGPFTISAIENGLPLRILSNGIAGDVKLYSTKENIKSINDLTPDSRITVSSRGSLPHLLFAMYCKEVFNDSMYLDTGVVGTPNADALGLMQTSQDFDAFLLTFPINSQIPEGTNYHLVEDLTNIGIKYDIGVWNVTTEEFERENPVLVEAYNVACQQAVDYVNNSTDEAAALLAELYGTTPEQTAQALRECPPTLRITGYDDIANLLYEMGTLTSPPKKFSELPNYDSIPK